MTNDIDIDLASIPHPKDCYLVPVGATIPPRTSIWQITPLGYLEWCPNGYGTPRTVSSDDTLYLTADPIVTPPAPPTPDDSPIVVTRTNKREVEPGSLAVWVHNDQEWCVVRQNGCSYWLDSREITDWLPAVTIATGRDVWDERDKRDRIDINGKTWAWASGTETWERVRTPYDAFGSLLALKRYFGDHYLTGFADEKSGEE